MITRGARYVGAVMDMGTAGARIVGSGLFRKAFGHHTYNGDAEAICTQIVQRLYDGKRGYFRTSRTTYPDFWARDFGRSVPSLIALGYREEVLSSYRYALDIYQKQNRFALVITPRGSLFDFPYYAPDGFAFFLRGLTFLDAPDLIARYQGFLERAFRHFVAKVVDRKTGLVRRDRHYSEAQDFTKRTSSCYSNAMCRIVQQAADALGLANPLARYDYTALIMEHFWAGDHFWDDMDKRPYVSGDACITPFLAGVVDDPQARFEIVLERMDREQLTRPYVARYGNTPKKNRPMIRIERFNKWQRDTVWTCLGLQLLDLLKQYDMNRYLLELGKLEQLVATLKCFPEVLFPDPCALYKGPFYMSEDSMLWAADLLRMLKERDRDASATRPERGVTRFPYLS